MTGGLNNLCRLSQYNLTSSTSIYKLNLLTFEIKKLGVLKIIFFYSDAQKFKERFEEAKKCMKEILEKGTYQKLYFGLLHFALVDTAIEFTLLMLCFSMQLQKLLQKRKEIR